MRRRFKRLLGTLHQLIWQIGERAQRVSLTVLAGMTIFPALFVLSVPLIVYTSAAIEAEKIRDVLALMQNDLESLGSEVEAQVNIAVERMRASKSDVRYREVGTGLFQKEDSNDFPLPDMLDLDADQLLEAAASKGDAAPSIVIDDQLFLFSLGSHVDVGELEEKIILELYSVNVARISAGIGAIIQGQPSLGYLIANPMRQVALTNMSHQDDSPLASFSAVEGLIKRGLAQGHLVQEEGNKSSIRAFRRVSGSNLAVFLTLGGEVVQDSVRSVMAPILIRFAALVVGIVTLFILMIWLLSRSINRTVRDVIAVSSGGLSLKVPVFGMGEVGRLKRSVSEMIASLREREAKNVARSKEREDSIRNEYCYDIINNFEALLMPSGRHFQLDGVVTGEIYRRPSQRISGDWHSFAVHPEEQRVLVVLANISTWGAAPAMLASVLAWSFERWIRCPKQGRIQVSRFFEDANLGLYSLAKGRLLASAVLIDLDLRASTLQIYNAGHPDPVVLSSNSDGELLPHARARIAHDPLGLGEDDVIVGETIVLDDLRHLRILLYSDFLVRVRNSLERNFCQRKIVRYLSHVGNEGAGLTENFMQSLGSLPSDGSLDDDWSIILIDWQAPASQAAGG